jgi:hypothetical protein
MNITDYLVDYLKAGNAVTIPQIGILAMQEVEAHFDSATSTFYPTRSTIQMMPDGTKCADFIQHLADKECVSKTTAEKIWKNYVDALTAKIASEGRCQLSDLGALVSTDGHYGFEPAETINLKETAQKLQPVTVMRTHTVASSDPFDAFEQPLKEGPVTRDSMLTGFTTEKEKFVPEPIIEEKNEPIVEEAEQLPEPESVVEEEAADEPESEPIVEVEAEAVTITGEETIDEPAVKTEEIEADPEPQQEPEQEPEQETEVVAETESTKVFDDDTINTLHQLDAIDQSDGSEEKAVIEKRKKKNTEKKKCRFWKALIWVIAILIILVACAFVIDRYIFNSQGYDWVMDKIDCNKSVKNQDDYNVLLELATPNDYSKENARDNTTEYTYSLEGLQFDNNEIATQRNEIVSSLNPYFKSFLKTLKQNDKEEMFLEQVEKYTDQRLQELTDDDDFYFQSLLNYKDYVREGMMPLLKEKLMRRKAIAVQSELLSYENLERLLGEVVPADELTPDPQALAEQQAAEQKAAAATKKTNKPAPVTSKVVTESKQGFDLIAGFSVNKTNADRLCSQLKSKGCDAYIINRNGLYYVSMGSAASRTEIEAKYVHIKEWYKGDVTIKKW